MIKVSRFLTAILLGVAVGSFVQPVQAARGGLRNDQEEKSVSEAFDRAIQHFDEWLTRMYDLTPDQQQTVHKRLLEMKEAQMDWGPDAEVEMNNISQEMRYYIEEARQGHAIDKQKVQELQERMISLVEKAPLSINSAVSETEKFLPPQQIQAGRERIREENDRLQREMVERDKSKPKMEDSTGMDLLKQYWKSDEEMMAISRRKLETGGYAPGESGWDGSKTPATPVTPAAPSAAPQTSKAAAPASGSAGSVRATASMPTISNPEDIDAWSKYVQAFIDKYQLDDRQKQQSWQIHGELKKRAEEYRTAHKTDYEAASRIENKTVATKELAELNKFVVGVFGELKARLDTIPTDEQRKVAEARPKAGPTTQKAVASAPASRPAVASRPAKATVWNRKPAGKVTAVRAAAPSSAPAAAK